jgi:Zn-dependent protease
VATPYPEAVPRPHFRLAGIPIRIEPVFLFIAAFWAYQPNLPLKFTLYGVAIVFVSILVHELGHAVLLRAYGQQPAIVLHGFGGFTTHGPGLSKARQILVSLAGAAAALAFLWLPSRHLFEQALHGTSVDKAYIFWMLARVNLWWSIFNLLPVLPLDGGHVSEQLLGWTRSRQLSVAVAGGGAVWALANHEQFMLLFAVLLGAMNFAELRRGGATVGRVTMPGRPPRSAYGGDGAPPFEAASDLLAPQTAATPEAVENVAWSLVRQGDAPGARRALGRMPHGNGPSPFLQGAVVLADGGGPSAMEHLEQAFASGVQPPNLLVAELIADHGVATRLAARLLGRGDAAGVDGTATLQTFLQYAGRNAQAALVGERLYQDPRANRAHVAFDVACAWSAAGEAERGLMWLTLAVEAGFSSPSVIDGQPELAPVRQLPGFPLLRSRLAPS